MAAGRPAGRERRRAILGGAALLGGVLGALAAPRRARAAQADAGGGIIGTWLVRGSREQTERPQGAAFMFFFLPGGVFQYFGPPQTPTTSREDDPAALEYRTVAGGQWLRTDFNEYRVAMVNVDYDGRGSPTGMDFNEATVTYDPLTDTISGTHHGSTQRDLVGQQNATLAGSFYRGTRVKVRA